MSDYSWVGPVVQAISNKQADVEAGNLTQQQFDLYKQQLAARMGIPLPSLERIVAEQMGPSALSGIRRDEGLRAKQLQALQSYQDIIDEGGMTLDDRVAEEAALSQADAADRRRRASIQADLASRGQLDSGAQLVASLSSAQDAANRGRQSGQESAARAQRRKLEALEALGRGAGSLREQDFGEAAQKARAQDDINRWNAGSRAEANKYNAGLNQQQFVNQLARATGEASAANNLAAAYGNESNAVRARGDARGQAASRAADRWTSGSGGQRRDTYSWDGRSPEYRNPESGERPRGYGADYEPVYSDEDEWEGW